MGSSKEYYQECRKTYKEAGVCTACHRADAVEGLTLCQACREKQKEQNHKRYMEHKTEINKRNNECAEKRYRERVLEGKCPRCGGVPEPGYVQCKQCGDKCRERRRKKYGLMLPRGERIENGLCFICGKPLMPGMGLCPVCYERLQRNFGRVA